GVNNQTESRWYCSIIRAIIAQDNGLNLDFDLHNWWNPEPRDTEKSLIGQLGEFIQSKLWSLLPPEDQDKNVLITIDEIDGVLGLRFSTDDFFALIRDFYNDRIHIPNLDRLAFCFLGVADHNDLMTDTNRTPFNNATFIDLKGFTFEEGIQGLFDELAKIVENPHEILTEIIEKTGGQPYLSQFLCDKIHFRNEKNPNIDQLITTYLINTQNLHFRRIEERINQYKQYKANLLTIYKRIRREGIILAGDISEKEKIYLKLSGLVVQIVEDGQDYLKVYNSIYYRKFNDIWIDSQLKSIPEKWYYWKENAWKIAKDNFYLLYGEQLRTALENKYQLVVDLPNFIEESDLEYRNVKRQITKTNEDDKKQIIIDRFIYWTNRQNDLF
ncbi:AAA-like domain-containing protein, partial [Geminocystis sp. GBBB08]|uniref:AAA-like domain-containing protein n=1 Tax=Geminocystis sp. GBBB08 TaxID=2604140 RepID=UPI0027E224E1